MGLTNIIITVTKRVILLSFKVFVSNKLSIFISSTLNLVSINWFESLNTAALKTH